MRRKVVILNYSIGEVHILAVPEGVVDIEDYLLNVLDLDMSSSEWMEVDHLKIDFEGM